MAANPDHIRRDAEHAARVEWSILEGKIKRRVYEDAKAIIARRITEADNGAVLDGTEIGRDALAEAAERWLGPELDPASESPALAKGDAD